MRRNNIRQRARQRNAPNQRAGGSSNTQAIKGIHLNSNIFAVKGRSDKIEKRMKMSTKVSSFKADNSKSNA